MPRKVKTATQSGKSKSQSSSTITAKIRFNRAAVLGLLGFSPSVKLEFGGKEWRQEFDEFSVLEVTINKAPSP